MKRTSAILWSAVLSAALACSSAPAQKETPPPAETVARTAPVNAETPVAQEPPPASAPAKPDAADATEPVNLFKSPTVFRAVTMRLMDGSTFTIHHDNSDQSTFVRLVRPDGREQIAWNRYDHGYIVALLKGEGAVVFGEYKDKAINYPVEQTPDRVAMVNDMGGDVSKFFENTAEASEYLRTLHPKALATILERLHGGEWGIDVAERQGGFIFVLYVK